MNCNWIKKQNIWYLEDNNHLYKINFTYFHPYGMISLKIIDKSNIKISYTFDWFKSTNKITLIKFDKTKPDDLVAIIARESLTAIDTLDAFRLAIKYAELSNEILDSNVYEDFLEAIQWACTDLN